MSLFSVGGSLLGRYIIDIPHVTGLTTRTWPPKSPKKLTSQLIGKEAFRNEISRKKDMEINKTTVRFISIRPYNCRIQVEIGRGIDLDTN